MVLNAEMTPRARRMLAYCAAGFLVYMMILFAEMIQNMHLNRIDEQLKSIDQQLTDYGMEVSTPPAKK